MSTFELNARDPGVNNSQVLCLRGQPLSIQDVHDVAFSRRRLSVTQDASVHSRMRAAEAVVREAVDSGTRVYGVTTGFGSMSEVPVPPEHAAASQANLLSFLATGAGRMVDPAHVRAAMLLRANMLLNGVSGVRMEIVQRLVAFLNADAVPMVHELGSIGASGDLVPLSTIARAITGQSSPCRVQLDGRQLDSQAALAELGLEPLELIPKEALALVNGTSFSAAIAANCIHAARDYTALSFATHGMMLRALLAHDEPFHPFVHQCKPHAGQIWSAETMLELLQPNPLHRSSEPAPSHLQDRYSLRCLPQCMGPIVEGISRVANVVETEMNAITDNPLIDVDNQRFYQSGNFLGQYLGIAMDDLRRFLGLLAKHLDVQIALLVSPEFSHGLPASLHGNGDLSFNMGLKGLQISGNSIMPLLTYLGNPLVEHFPTHAEQFNQNVNGLSWGAAHLAGQSVELYRHYASLALIFAVQAVDLRAKVCYGHYDGRYLLGDMLTPLYEAVYETVDRRPSLESPLIYNDADQSLEINLAQLANSIGGRADVVSAVLPIVESLIDFNRDC